MSVDYERHAQLRIDFGLQLDHRKVDLAGATLWTDPILRHIFPTCTGCYSVVRQAMRFVIFETTEDAEPALARGVIYQI